MNIQATRLTKTIMGALFSFGISLSPAFANGSSAANPASFVPPDTVITSPGGRIIDFALQAAQYRESHRHLRFAGQCDSACTLFLALPRNQMCVSPGAYFRFHAPYSANQRAAFKAKEYLLRKYPGWVRSFIAQRGGLTSNLITMDYAVASKYIPVCGSSVASR